MRFARRIRIDRAKVLGVISGMSVGLGAYQADAVDMLAFDIPERPSHYEMSARVVSVTKVCRLQFESGSDRFTRPMRCLDARRAVKRPLFTDYTVVERDHVEYRYYGPRGNELNGRLEVGHGADGPEFSVNDLFPIRVDIENPKIVERL